MSFSKVSFEAPFEIIAFVLNVMVVQLRKMAYLVACFHQGINFFYFFIFLVFPFSFGFRMSEDSSMTNVNVCIVRLESHTTNICCGLKFSILRRNWNFEMYIKSCSVYI